MFLKYGIRGRKLKRTRPPTAASSSHRIDRPWPAYQSIGLLHYNTTFKYWLYCTFAVVKYNTIALLHQNCIILLLHGAWDCISGVLAIFVQSQKQLNLELRLNCRGVYHALFLTVQTAAWLVLLYCKLQRDLAGGELVQLGADSCSFRTKYKLELQ